MLIKPISLPRPASQTGKLIYGYNPSTNIFQTWNSLEKCTEALIGNRFVNKATVNMLRVARQRYIISSPPFGGVAGEGYFLQTKPFTK